MRSGLGWTEQGRKLDQRQNYGRKRQTRKWFGDMHATSAKVDRWKK